ncbi:MAG TPA: response regulator [Dehalococcoidia bacterium]
MLQALNPKDARVLVVEDSPSDQAIASRALKTFGIRHMRLADTAEDALNELGRRDYDVVLVDYQLPGMNGLQLVERLRALAPATRVIIVTGARQESIAVAAMKMGVSDYISKDEFLTSGIVRSLQAALRDRVATAEDEQRRALGARERELQEALAEATWLLQAIDARHGYLPLGKGARDPIGEEFADVVAIISDYIVRSCRAFPEPATDLEDGLIRMTRQRGISPRDLLRAYIASLRQLIYQEDGLAGTRIRPVLFLTHVLACLMEDLQAQVSVRELNRSRNDSPV